MAFKQHAFSILQSFSRFFANGPCVDEKFTLSSAHRRFRPGPLETECRHRDVSASLSIPIHPKLHEEPDRNPQIPRDHLLRFILACVRSSVPVSDRPADRTNIRPHPRTACRFIRIFGMTNNTVIDSAEFTTQQKEYLLGFFGGLAQRGLIPFVGHTADGLITSDPASGPLNQAAETEPLWFNTTVSDLSREERWKLEQDPLSIWDKLLQYANQNQPPTEEDRFRIKYFGLFYVAPALAGSPGENCVGSHSTRASRSPEMSPRSSGVGVRQRWHVTAGAGRPANLRRGGRCKPWTMSGSGECAPGIHPTAAIHAGDVRLLAPMIAFDHGNDAHP